MEQELKCPVCKQFLSNPVLLPCCHSLCLNCSLKEQGPIDISLLQENSGSSVSTLASISNSSSASDSNTAPLVTEYVVDNDKQSVHSESDSGVVCNSRPNSSIGFSTFLGVTTFVGKFSRFVLVCPICQQTIYLDENGSFNLPRYHAIQNIIDKYTNNTTPKCHLCPQEPPLDANVFCEQCEVLYCNACRERCHPSRGPLMKHLLIEFNSTKNILLYKTKKKEYHCYDHIDQLVSLYCIPCKVPVCALCLRDMQHTNHEVRAISAVCKEQKLELSQSLQQLSIKARNMTENLTKLRNLSCAVDVSCVDLEGQIVAQCDAIIQAVNEKKLQLIDEIRQHRDMKKKLLSNQITDNGLKLQQATGFFQFCFEIVKEPDATAFLQVGSALMNRINNMELSWCTEIDVVPKVSSQFDLTLDQKSVIKAIEELNFIQMKVPDVPFIIAEECSTENNVVTVAWRASSVSYVEGYLLELDDGYGGDFKEVFCGKETMCSVDGLHFGCMYRARVKAFNNCGEGEYSDIVGLQTTDVAWFTLEPCLSSSDICFLSDGNNTITCEGFEHRVAVGNIGFSNGVHYWQFTIDRYDSDTDPSFGVAVAGVSKDLMLGKDSKGWAMYIDRQRSWFMHNDVHENRQDGGIETGCTVGVLLDLVKHQLSFFVNDEPQGPVAFRNMYGMFYPAISINRGVTVTLHSSLDPPSDIEDS